MAFTVHSKTIFIFIAAVHTHTNNPSKLLSNIQIKYFITTTENQCNMLALIKCQKGKKIALVSPSLQYRASKIDNH